MGYFLGVPKAHIWKSASLENSGLWREKAMFCPDPLEEMASRGQGGKTGRARLGRKSWGWCQARGRGARKWPVWPWLRAELGTVMGCAGGGLRPQLATAHLRAASGPPAHMVGAGHRMGGGVLCQQGDTDLTAALFSPLVGRQGARANSPPISHAFTLHPLSPPVCQSTTLTIAPNSQMRKLRHGDKKTLVQVYTASESWKRIQTLAA